MKKSLKVTMMVAVALLVGVTAVQATQEWTTYWSSSTTYRNDKPYVQRETSDSEYILIDSNANENETLANEAFVWVGPDIAVMGTHLLNEPRGAFVVTIPNYDATGGVTNAEASDDAEAYMESTSGAEVRVEADGDVVITLGS